MLFRIMASKNGEAYAEMIRGYKQIADGRVYVEDMNGSMSFTRKESIIEDPEIISCVSEGCHIYKIRME